MSENKPQQSLDLSLFINDQYVTVKKIGQGGMGVVWQAYDFSLRNFIAVKELLSEFSEPKFVEMFYKEALIAKNIIHDNLVRVQHLWKGNYNSFYISMDFVRGVDLEDLIKRCNELKIKIPWELSVLICISMLKAIDYANRIARDSITGKPYGIVY
ncbi:MAG: protein kinase, partial [Endomicrobium sp.]|nr:protein kinase [Endomicrobium sp.]